ncbi:MAG: hypothetical protein M8861_09345 [marine benthic group bacterium]|nr:hypothetical protein [Gemmatimonadota bacterium]
MKEDQQDDSPETPEWRVPGDEQLETDAYHVWKPRPLLRSVHWKPVPAPSREAAVGSYDVFVDQRVLKALHQHIWNAAPTESPHGFLVGDLCEDPDTGRRYVIVSAAVPSRFPMVEEGPEQIQGEALVAMQLEVDRRRGVLAGWYHRHRDGPVELTAEDLKTHERHFPEPWQVALLFITDYAEPTGGCFRRTRDGLAGDVPLPFFEMVSNESLLARGVRRSHMDWVNVETVDSIDHDPPSRPEPPPEPEPEPELAPQPEPETEPESEPEPAPDASEEADTPADSGTRLEDDEVDFSLAPGLDATQSVEVDLAEGGPIGGLEDEPAPLVDESLEDDVDFELFELADDVAEVEDGASRIDTEEIPADIEPTEPELILPVLDELADPESDVEPADQEAEADDDLPEPGWDSGDSASDLSLPPVEDMDLDSFVTEVETADVAAQVDAAIDMEAIEPGWDDADIEEGPVVDVEPVPTLPEAFDEVLPDLPEDSDEVLVAEPVEDAWAEEELEPEMAPVPEGAPKPPRSRRTTMVFGGVLLAAAIVVSVLVFLLPSGGATEDGSASQAVPAAGTEDAQGQAEVPADDPSVEPGETEAGESETVEPGEALVAVDSAAVPVSVADVERLGDDLLEAISRYYGRAVAVDDGQATCSDLQAAYVQVEDNWIGYNVQGRARFRGRLPDELATRDERLYAGVQDVEREFTRSGCERP